ncbi:hypothetical protein [Akkermansia glycaniphila]|nr:hypothetical protein [Akkermansia glycaniphila]
MAEFIGLAYDDLPPLGDLHDPMLYKPEYLTRHEEDHAMAEAIVHYWKHGEWPALPGHLPLQLAYRLLFVEWYFHENHCWHPDQQDSQMQAMVMSATAATDIWHHSGLIWLLDQFGIDDHLEMGECPPQNGDPGNMPILNYLLEKIQRKS